MNPCEIFKIPLTEINENKFKRNINVLGSFKELIESIKLFGLIQPIVLNGQFGHPPYDVIVGQRRFLAHKFMAMNDINAVFSGTIDDIGATLISLAENMHRLDLDYADKAKTITKLFIHFNRNEEDVRKATGLSLRTIRDYIKIDEQATPLGLKMLLEKDISKPDLKRVIDIAHGNENKLTALLTEIKTLSRHEKDRAVKFGKNNPKASVHQILEDAKKPKIEDTVMLNLPMKVTKALRNACEELSIEKEAFTLDILTQWLTYNNFLEE